MVVGGKKDGMIKDTDGKEENVKNQTTVNTEGMTTLILAFIGTKLSNLMPFHLHRNT
jgi:hypothetical protein